MIFTPLASSSHGNAYIVSDGKTRLLLECGVSYKQLKRLCGFDLAGVSGCLVSHEHKDHSHCAAELLRDGVRVYMSFGTAEALEAEEAELLTDREQVTVGTMDVVPFRTFHDAREPMGFLIQSRVDGDILAFATDTCNLGYRFPGVTILALEANYDPEILARCQRMPDKVRHRIVNSHMSIDTLCGYLRELDLSGCRELWLLHLSDATSHEGHFINKVSRVVPNSCRVLAAPREV